MNGLRINHTGFERFKLLISVTSLPQESMVTDSCLGELSVGYWQYIPKDLQETNLEEDIHLENDGRFVFKKYSVTP